MLIRNLLVLGVVALSLPAIAHAERVALVPASGTNLHQGYLQATQDLTRGHLEAAGYDVVVLPGENGAREPASAEAYAAAQSVGARLAVVVHVIRLGNSAKVKLTAYDTATGEVSFRDQLTADTPDNIDIVLTRLVRAMVEGRPASETADIHTVTDADADPLRKQIATSVFGMRIGVVLPLDAPDGGDEVGLPGMGMFWLYDVRTFLAEVAVDFHIKDSENDFTVALGSYYPLSKENTTTYVGGGLRYGFANYAGNAGTGGNGVSLYMAGGMLIGRLSSVQIRAQLDLFFNLFHERDALDNTNRSSGLHASFGLGF